MDLRKDLMIPISKEIKMGIMTLKYSVIMKEKDWGIMMDLKIVMDLLMEKY